ncbi:unnamed protein product, partial [Mesorhabditis belari]|uniref:Puromycin-sensitive aminopeptidase n=1 Tax=Mesorhabditis belari TaxID=2138241 RepID=A0AAF3F179_9BILA
MSPFSSTRFHSIATGSFAMASTCPAGSIVKEKYERLPDYAAPTHYKIRLEPDFSSFTFKGCVEIDLDVLKATKWDHFEACEWTRVAKLAAHVFGKVNNACDRFTNRGYSQKVQLKIDYMGVHNDKMQGFYRSKYLHEGQEKWILATQFESTYAREAFPCFDEPMYKATYDVTLVVDDGLTALSNAPVRAESKEGKKHIVTFDTTPKMSSYLVAFAVGHFEYLEQKSSKGTLIRVYTVPGKKHLGEFALEVGTKSIDWYADWFGIPYSMPKCDLIAIPDFSMGAMENWGLVTFREIALLFDAEKTSTKQKAYVALVIAHELAHLWFGDLVTMKWWTDLWLKEGFASFMEYLFVGYNYPEMKIWLHFLNDELASGFELDALKNSHPIEVPIDNPNELDEIYDSITYAKSNSVNRMLCFYLGEESFQKGLRIYLQRFQFSNAETNDLWKCLSEASGVDVMALMSGWTKQMGFPVVAVSKVSEDDKNLKLSFTQKRFIADGSEDSADSLWKVPLTFSSTSSPDQPFHRTVLSERSSEQSLAVAKGEWLKVNQGTTGFYRVKYSGELLEGLLKAVANQTLPVLDRFGLSNDLFALANAGQVPISQVLSFVESSLKENEYSVWRTLDLGIVRISDTLAYFDSDGALKKRF